MERITPTLPSQAPEQPNKACNSVDVGIMPRNILIGLFQEKINKEREGTKYEPMTARGVAIKVGHLKRQDLVYLAKECDRKGEWGKIFFGSLKIK